MLGNPFEGHTTYDMPSETGEPIRLTGVISVAFSPDGKYIASGAHDRTVKVWDAENGKLSTSFEGHGHFVTSVSYSPDGKFIVSGSYDMTLRIWDVENRKAVGEPLQGHTHFVTSVALSPHGKCIASASCDGTVRLWNMETRKLVCEPLEGHTQFVQSVAYSPNGRIIVSGSYDTTIRLWDAETGTALRKFVGHTRCVSSVAFSPNGKYVVSGSWDRTIRLWEVELQCRESDPKTILGSVGSERPCDWGLTEVTSHSLYTIDINHRGPQSLIKKEPSSSHDWTVQHGWVSCNSNLLLWLPRSHRIGFWLPHTRLVISRKQTLVSYESFVHGEEWTDCYDLPHVNVG
jgi:WD40 repeat protein